MRNKSRENLIYRAKNITLAGGNVKRTHPFFNRSVLLTFEKVYVVRLQNHLYEGFDGLLIFFRKDQYAVNQFCIRSKCLRKKKKLAFAACAGHLIEIVRPSEAEGSFVVSSGCSSDTGTSSEFVAIHAGI